MARIFRSLFIYIKKIDYVANNFKVLIVRWTDALGL